MRSMFVFGVAAFLASTTPCLATPSICDGTAGNLILNCGFELGDYADWSLAGTAIGSSLIVAGNSGLYGGMFTALPEGSISQTFPSVPGALYNVQFYLEDSFSINQFAPNDFTVYWDGTELMSLVNAAAFPFTAFDIPNQVGTGSDTIEFSLGTSSAFWFFDDVSVTAQNTPVPEVGTLYLVNAGALVALGRWKARR